MFLYLKKCIHIGKYRAIFIFKEIYRVFSENFLIIERAFYILWITIVVRSIHFRHGMWTNQREHASPECTDGRGTDVCRRDGDLPSVEHIGQN